MPPRRLKRTILVGMGNPILADDAIGIRLATDFRARHAAEPGLDIVEECGVGGLHFLELVTGYDRLIILDSIKTKDGIPGTWYEFGLTSLRETMNLRNVHDTNLATALELGRRLGMRVPPEAETFIFAVEIADNATFSTHLTPAVESAYAELASQIFAGIEVVLAAE
jgi:hydrogenase maturation protease